MLSVVHVDPDPVELAYLRHPIGWFSNGGLSATLRNGDTRFSAGQPIDTGVPGAIRSFGVLNAARLLSRTKIAPAETCQALREGRDTNCHAHGQPGHPVETKTHRGALMQRRGSASPVRRRRSVIRQRPRSELIRTNRSATAAQPPSYP